MFYENGWAVEIVQATHVWVRLVVVMVVNEDESY
jgi:hypothetical protein